MIVTQLRCSFPSPWTSQVKTGEFSRWLTPSFLLLTRKGGVNDHAVFLCSVLIGLKYDAYVCKGTSTPIII